MAFLSEWKQCMCMCVSERKHRSNINWKAMYLIQREKQCSTQSNWFCCTSKQGSLDDQEFRRESPREKNFKPPEFFKKPREMVLAPEINSPDIPATREQKEALSFIHHLLRSPNQTNQQPNQNKQTNKKSTEATRGCNLSIRTTMNFQRTGHIQEELPVYICPTVVTLSKTSIITHRVVETTCIAKWVLSFT